MSRHQQAVIEYLQEENRILLEQLGGKPNRFTDAQRIRLARKAKLVGRRRLGKLATLVTPGTLPLVPCLGRQKVDLSQDQSPRSTTRRCGAGETRGQTAPRKSNLGQQAHRGCAGQSRLQVE